MGTFVARSEQLKGHRLGGYEIVRLIGHGATASVFEAVQLALGKRVAVKILHEHLASDEQVLNRFLREGRIAARLRHPNTVAVLDVGVEGEAPYLVMELLNGTDLRALLADTHLLTIEHALDFLLPIASALAQAHDAGVIHRDLKPANIFLDRDLRDDVVPKLLDFGLSKVANAATTSELTATELVAGTVLYMAPEQTLGVRNSSPASDQYSLAAILYECVTGEAPFHADGIYALIERIRTELVRPPSLLNPRLTEDFDGVVLRALHRDAAKRWPNVRTFARALLPFAAAATRHALERDFFDRPSGGAKALSSSAFRSAVMAVDPRRHLPSVPADVAEGSASAPTPQVDAPLPCPPGMSPFHIKGMPYRGFRHLVKKLLPGGIDAFASALGDDELAAFIRQPFLASGRYDLLPLLPLFAAVARITDRPFEPLVQDTAAAQARYDSRTVFKAIWRSGDVDGMAERMARFGAQYYDFGQISGSVPAPNTLAIVHAGVPAYVYPWYAPMHVAYTEETARILGAREVTSVTLPPLAAGSYKGFDLVTARTEIRWNRDE